MHTPPQLDLDPQQGRLHALANRVPKHHVGNLGNLGNLGTDGRFLPNSRRVAEVPGERCEFYHKKWAAAGVSLLGTRNIDGNDLSFEMLGDQAKSEADRCKMRRPRTRYRQTIELVLDFTSKESDVRSSSVHPSP